MDNALAATNPLSLTIALIGGWYLLFVAYSDLRVDQFRQEMFKIRDSMFDEAARSPIPFDHPAYGLLRTTMNGYIRFAHRLSPLGMLFVLYVLRSARQDGGLSEYTARRASAFSELPLDQAQRLRGYEQCMTLLVLRHLLLSSPVLALLVHPVGIALRLISKGDRATRRARPWIERLSSVAIVHGEEKSYQPM